MAAETKYDYQGVDFARDERTRERFLHDANRLMQVDIGLKDAIWKWVDRASASLQNGIFLHADMSERRMFDALAAYEVQTFGVGSENLLIKPGAVHEVTLWGKGAVAKGHSGDALALSTTVDPKTREYRFGGEVRDGVTEMPATNEGRVALLDRLRPLLPDIDYIPADKIANQVIRAMREMVRQVSVSDLLLQKRSQRHGFPVDSHPMLDLFTEEELHEADYLMRVVNGPDRLSAVHGANMMRHPGADVWMEQNILLGLAYGTFKRRRDDDARNPGVTGSEVIIQESYVSSQTQVFAATIADGVEVQVYTSGQIALTAISTNFMFDRETVLKIRGLLSLGRCRSVAEAQEILRSQGHYDQSYQIKRRGHMGAVAVCDGSRGFSSQLYSSFPSMGTTGLTVARYFLSDGFLAPFMPTVGQPDTRGIVNLVRQLLVNNPAVIASVESIEAENMFDADGLPVREKISDDKSGIGFVFMPKRVVEEVLPRLSLVG